MKKVDTRQSVFRGTLQEIFPYTPGQSLDTLLSSINTDLTAPLTVDASSTPDRVVHIDGSSVANTISNRNKSISFINNLIPVFSSGTVTFPAANGGTITPSPGTPSTLTLPSGQYAQALLSLDQTGNIIVTVGTPTGSLPATVPPPTSNTLPFAYVTLHNTGGTVDNIAQSSIFQLPSTSSTSQVLTVDNSTLQLTGNVLSVKPLGITGAYIANGTITPGKIAPNYVVSGSSGAFSNSGSVLTAVTNLSVTITSSGNPVEIMGIPDNTTGSFFDNSYLGATTGGTVFSIILYKNGSPFSQAELDVNPGADAVVYPPGMLRFFDFTPGASPNTYALFVKGNTGTILINHVVLLAKEMV